MRLSASLRWLVIHDICYDGYLQVAIITLALVITHDGCAIIATQCLHLNAWGWCLRGTNPHLIMWPGTSPPCYTTAQKAFGV